MKVIQIPYTFYPNNVGGTEIYVLRLSKELIKNDIEVVIVYPGELKRTYEHDGVRVRTFQVNMKVSDISELYGQGNDSIALNSFSEILEEEHPDLIHFHSLTNKITKDIIRKIKSKNIPIVFTYHTPTVTCQRGTLMKWGKEVCNGFLDVDVCTKCTLNGLGLPKFLACIIGSVSPVVDKILGKYSLWGSMLTALRMRGLTKSNHLHIIYFLNKVDHVITVCNWTKGVLEINGIPSSKISVCPHGLSKKISQRLHVNRDKLPDRSILKIMFIGRINKVKGLDVLIKAVRNLANLNLLLDIYGTVQIQEDENYLGKLKKIVDNDSRINFKLGLLNEEVLNVLSGYDVAAVPSQWMETGPLVVLEAFSACVPVLGSNLGGIAELVENNVNGLLVKHDSFEEWTSAIKLLYENRELLSKLKEGIKQESLREDNFYKIIEIYNSLVQRV